MTKHLLARYEKLVEMNIAFKFVRIEFDEGLDDAKMVGIAESCLHASSLKRLKVEHLILT